MENWSNSRVMMIPQCVNNGIMVFKKNVFMFEFWLFICLDIKTYNILPKKKCVCLFKNNKILCVGIPII